MSETEERLVTKQQLLAELFDDKSRPTLRWLDYQIAARLIPYYKIGRKVFFNPVKVRETLDKRNFVAPVR